MCDPPECRTNPGRWTCTVKGSVCEPTRSSESCDGIDNDCNGRTDDIPSTACMGPVPPSADGVFQGCPSLMLPGMTACTGGTSRCEVTRGYCAWDSIGNAIDASVGSLCFTGRGGPCEVAGCFAGEWCCSPNPDPAGGAECTPIGELNDPGNPPIVLSPPPTGCWLPGAMSAARCPAPADCNRRDSCGDCARDSRCGWCEPYDQCLPGTNAGPTTDSIGCGVLNAADGWIRDPTLPWCS